MNEEKVPDGRVSVRDDPPPPTVGPLSFLTRSVVSVRGEYEGVYLLTVGWLTRYRQSSPMY